MDIWHVKCSNCGYETNLLLGGTDLNQTYSDLNEDFSFYSLFICKQEKIFVTVNTHDAQFNGVCAKDGSKLVPVEEAPPKKCPKCNNEISPKRLDMNEILGE